MNKAQSTRMVADTAWILSDNDDWLALPQAKKLLIVSLGHRTGALGARSAILGNVKRFDVVLLV